MSQFEKWFKAQFKGVPNQNLFRKLMEQRLQLERELESVNKKIDEQVALSVRYEAASYARNAAEKGFKF